MGFEPPVYPYARLDGLRRTAGAAEGGIVDLSVGTPCDPVPEVVVRALADAAPAWAGYSSAVGIPALREAAAGWIARRFGIGLGADEVMACVGTKELVSSLPHLLRLRRPERDTVLYPAVSYPTYEMGAILAGCRAVPVALDDSWHLDLATVGEEDAARALVLWINEPANPTGSAAGPGQLSGAVQWARARGIVVASDECYVLFTNDPAGRPAAGATALAAGADGVLTVHSLSKRSNMAGYRSGFVAGDGDLVAYLGQVRTHAGMMTPGPVQAAAVAAWWDDAHVDEQRAVYARRRHLVTERLAAAGLVPAGGPATFYLWLAAADPGRDPDGWSIAGRLAASGTLVAAGELYGPAGAPYVRMALVQPDDRLELALERAARPGAAGS